MTYTINIPTANLRFSTTVKSQEVYQGVSKYAQQLKTAAETGSTYISGTMTDSIEIPTTIRDFR